VNRPGDGRDGPHEQRQGDAAGGEQDGDTDARPEEDERDGSDGGDRRDERDGRDGRRSGDPGGHVKVVGRKDVDGKMEVVHLAELRGEPSRPFLNLPNALTFLRALLVPVIFLLLLADTQAAQWWAFGIFVFAALTDTVDGWVARRWHGVTRWGQFADPIADKILVIGTLAAIAVLGTLPWWAVIVIAVREIAVTVLRVRIIFDIDVVVPASVWGKAKTLSQLVAVGLYLLPGVGPDLRLGVLYVAVILTVVSGVDYAFKAGGIIRESQNSGESSP
jgi:CDP-diacylglycerol---glycerol-3-phosphate 3-phosphatidyltransferase